MTGMVQPDVGPSAKYKENSVDDPVSIISILRGTLSFFPSNSCLPYRFCEMFPTSISFLSFLVISLCRAALCPVGFLFFFFSGQLLDICHDIGFLFFRLASLSPFWSLCRVSSIVNTSTRRQPPIQDADIGSFGVCWP